MMSETAGLGVAERELVDTGRRGAGDCATLMLATDRSSRLMSTSPTSVFRRSDDSDGDSVDSPCVPCGARRCSFWGEGARPFVTGRTVGDGGSGMAATACTSVLTGARAGGVLSSTIRSKSLTLALTRPTGGGTDAGAVDEDARGGRASELPFTGMVRSCVGDGTGICRELEPCDVLRSFSCCRCLSSCSAECGRRGSWERALCTGGRRGPSSRKDEGGIVRAGLGIGACRATS